MNLCIKFFRKKSKIINKISVVKYKLKKKIHMQKSSYKPRIGIFGGSFNPPTIAHFQVDIYLLKQNKINPNL